MSNTTKAAEIDRILEQRKIIITCGTGGVGKTTLSAAIAFRAALSGKRTAVITIDPAKRLATSLGLQQLGSEPTDITKQLLRAYEKAKAANMPLPRQCTGTLHAYVPDNKSSFEGFINNLSPSKKVAERVLSNPIFQIFTKEFSGTLEYMAMERLHALTSLGTYDCIVLDTPPSRNALAFLDAPKLLTHFFEEKLIRWLVLPTNKLVSVGVKKALGVMERLTGAGFMTNLFDFASTLFEVRVKFAANLKSTIMLLESPAVGFIMVSVPAQDTAEEIKQFVKMLGENKFHFDGVALNRTLGYLEVPDTTQKAAYGKELKEAFLVLRALQDRESNGIQCLEKALGGENAICAKLPELARDVHCVEDLFHVAMAFGSLEPLVEPFNHTG